ncbi:MAG: PGF-pre-PGF domain-containing protein [Nanoarchaeota archaeon]|nr:PGF-pre-PGF domain-containing protein [Nanoarchaeota archaeon]
MLRVLLTLLLLATAAGAADIPTVTITSPANNLYTGSAQVVFSFTVSGDGDAFTCSLFIDGTEVDQISVAGGGSFNRQLTEGPHTWRVDCLDMDGDTGSSGQRTLTVDLTDPVFLSHNTPAEFPAGGIIPIRTYWTEANPSKQKLYVGSVLYEEKPWAGDVTFGYPTDTEDALTYLSFRVTAIDKVQHSASSGQMQVYLTDNTPPEISALWPPDDAQINSQQLTIRATTEDNAYTFVTCILHIDSSQQSSASDGQHLFNLNLEPGQHTWHLECSDDSGNEQSTLDRDFIIDITKPTPGQISGPTGPQDTGDDITFSVDWDETIHNASLMKNDVKISTEDFDSSTTELTYHSLAGDAQQTHSFSIRGRDYAGNVGESEELEVSFLDNTPPTVELLTPEDDSYMNSAVTFTFSVEDNLDQELSCALYIDGQPKETRVFQAGTASFRGVDLANGPHTWHVICIDGSGNEPDSYDSFAITLDRMPPGGSSTTAPRQTGTAQLQGTAWDDGAGVKEVIAESPFGENLGTETGWRFEGSDPLDDGAYSVLITVFDMADNPFELYAGFTYDSTPPAVDITGPANTQDDPLTQDTTTMTFSVGDDAVSVHYTLNGGTEVDIPLGTSSVGLQIIQSGRQVLKLYAEDDLGNTGMDTQVFYVALPLDMLAWTQSLMSDNPFITQVKVFDSLGIDVSNDNAVDINDEFTIRITFPYTAGTVSGQATAIIDSFNGMEASWGSPFSVSDADSAIEDLVEEHGTTVESSIIFSSAGDFLGHGSYSASVVFPTDVPAQDRELLYIDGESLERLAGCGSPPCYDAGTETEVSLAHFSGIIISHDTIAPTIEMTSPDAEIDYSDFVYLAWTTNEPVACRYDFLGSSYEFDQASDFSSRLLGTLPGYVLKNGDQDVFLRCWDPAGNTRQVNYRFTVDDQAAPTITTVPEHDSELESYNKETRFKVTTDEIANVSYSINNRPYNRLITLGKEGSITLTGDKGLAWNNNSIKIIASDMNGKKKTMVLKFWLRKKSDSQGPYQPHVPFEPSYIEKRWGFINPDESAIWTIYEEGFDIRSVSVKFKDGASSPSLRLSKITRFTPKPEGEVLAYYDFEPLAFGEIKHASITFVIPKQGGKEVVLMRYDNGWQELTTSLIADSQLYATYRAITPGFSAFAIVIRQPAPPIDDPVEPPEDDEPDVFIPGPPADDDVPEDKESYVWIILVVGILALIGLGVVALKKVKKHPFKELAKRKARADHEHYVAKNAEPTVEAPEHMAEELPELDGLPSMESGIPTELESFVHDALEKGLNKDQIRHMLKEKGWDPAAVEQVLSRSEGEL